jgi:hypothetical protein
MDKLIEILYDRFGIGIILPRRLRPCKLQIRRRSNSQENETRKHPKARLGKKHISKSNVLFPVNSHKKLIAKFYTDIACKFRAHGI